MTRPAVDSAVIMDDEHLKPEGAAAVDAADAASVLVASPSPSTLTSLPPAKPPRATASSTLRDQV